jgi:hypothetical protein
MAQRTNEGSELLRPFLGDWWAEGTSDGGDDQSPESPHAGASPWRSTHTARWFSEGYFLVQDERANGPFETLTVMGWDRDAERFFARSFENHGFSRDYTMTFDGLAVRLDGEYERATYTFDAAGDTQTVAWQWRRGENWLPLCDRVAHRVDPHPA